MLEVRFTITDPIESEVINKLITSKELTPKGLFMQSLRLYQLIDALDMHDEISNLVRKKTGLYKLSVYGVHVNE